MTGMRERVQGRGRGGSGRWWEKGEMGKVNLPVLLLLISSDFVCLLAGHIKSMQQSNWGLYLYFIAVCTSIKAVSVTILDIFFHPFEMNAMNSPQLILRVKWYPSENAQKLRCN